MFSNKSGNPNITARDWCWSKRICRRGENVKVVHLFSPSTAKSFETLGSQRITSTLKADHFPAVSAITCFLYGEGERASEQEPMRAVPGSGCEDSLSPRTALSYRERQLSQGERSSVLRVTLGQSQHLSLIATKGCSEGKKWRSHVCSLSSLEEERDSNVTNNNSSNNKKKQKSGK